MQLSKGRRPGTQSGSQQFWARNIVSHDTSTNLAFPFNVFAVEERLHLATDRRALTNPGQLPRETFALFTMIGVTTFALLSIWHALQSSHWRASKGTNE
jgi:hypothetical protein